MLDDFHVTEVTLKQTNEEMIHVTLDVFFFAVNGTWSHILEKTFSRMIFYVYLLLKDYWNMYLNEFAKILF